MDNGILQQIFYLIIGLLLSAGIYYLSTLPQLPQPIRWAVVGLSILIGGIAALAFLAFILHVHSPFAL